MVVADEQQLVPGSYQTPVTEHTAVPPYYFLPLTLRSWPWQREISPHYRSCQTECAAWFENFKPSPKLQASFNKADYCLLTAMAYHRSSPSNLCRCSEMMYTVFMLDDHTTNLPTDVVIDRCEATMDAILYVDKPRPKGEHVLGEMTRQFWKRASSKMPRVVIERFETSWRKYIDAIIRQAQNHSQKYICTPEEYMDARCDDIGAYLCFVMLEETLELDLAHEVMEHPYLQSLNKYACQMIYLDNDMISYKKELLADEADFNAITVVQKCFKKDLDSTLKWLLEYYDHKAENFLAIREKVLTKDGFPLFGPRIDREIADYVDGLGNFVRGHSEWLFGSGRYFGNDGLEVQKHRKVVLG